MEIYGHYESDQKCDNCIYLRWPTDGPVHGFNTCLVDGKNYLRIRRCAKFKELTLDSTFTVTMHNESIQATIMEYINYLENRVDLLKYTLEFRNKEVAVIVKQRNDAEEKLYKLEGNIHEVERTGEKT